MAIKSLKPTTPGTRGMTTQDFSSVTTKKPVKSLTVIKKGSVGFISRHAKICGFWLPPGWLAPRHSHACATN